MLLQRRCVMLQQQRCVMADLPISYNLWRSAAVGLLCQIPASGGKKKGPGTRPGQVQQGGCRVITPTRRGDLCAT